MSEDQRPPDDSTGTDETPASDAARAKPQGKADNTHGKQLGDFELLREVGRGGMGVVYESRQISLNRRVALKVLPPGLGLTETAVQRFEREAHAAAKLHHTNIVPVYATGEEEGAHYYAMELIEGDSLGRILNSLRGQGSHPLMDEAVSRTAAEMPESKKEEAATPATGTTNAISLSDTSSGSRAWFETVATLLSEVADALHYAHGRGVIHRDVKPSNLMMSQDGRLFLSDFGLARVAQEPGMTVSGSLLGTPAYMSPEQITAGRVQMDHRTDVYSLGAVMYEMLTLRRPFSGDSREKILAAIMAKDPRAPRRYNPRIPIDLETICQKAMEKDPDRRYQSAGDFANDLKRYLARGLITARRAGLARRTWRSVRRHPVATTVAVAVVLLFVVGGVALRNAVLRSEEAAARAVADARFAFSQGEYRRSLERADEALARSPEHPEARLMRARSLWYLYRPREAMEEAKAKLEEDPDDWTSHLILAMLAEWNPEISAEEHLAVVEKKAPETADTYYLRSYTVDSVAEQIALLDRALELDPGHSDALFWRVIKHTYATKDFKAALRDSERMIAVRPRSSHGRMLLSQVLKEQRDWEQAILEINRAIELDPEDPMNFYWRAIINWNMGRLDDAVADADRTVALGPRSPGFHWLSAAVSNVFGKHDDAVIKARRAIELDPDHRDAYGVLFSALWSMKQEDALRKAMDQLRSRAEIWADDEARAGAYRQLSEWNRTLENTEQALADAERAIKLAPDNYGGYHKRALVRQKLEGPPGIREDCDLLAALAIEDVGDDLGRANLLRVFCEQPDEALASLTAVNERAPHWADPYNARALLYMGRSESEKAIQDLDKAIELAPAWAELYDSRAWCHRNERRFGKAWADIGKAIELAPDYPQAIFSRAFFHMDAERFEEALADWAELTEKFPWAWEASWQQAITLLRLGREEEALAVAERAIENSREVEWVHTRLGLILNAIGRVDEAIEALDHTIELFPKSAWPYSIRARAALCRPGSCDRALTDLRTAAEHAPDDFGLMTEIAWVFAGLVFSQCPDKYSAELALDYARKAVKDKPQEAQRQNDIGWVLYREGKLREAREALLKAMDRRIPEPEPWELFGMAMTEWKLGNRSEARDYYDRAVARAEHTFPKFPEFTVLKEEAAELLGVEP